MIKTKDAIREARALLGTPYAELDCINLIKAVIRKAPGGVKTYTTAGSNALWRSFDAAPKVFTATNAASKGEKLWFGDTLYESLMDGNVYTPEQYPAGWVLFELY